MATGSSSCGGNWRLVGAVSGRFPTGLSVLVVDDDPTCLLILDRMLKSCLYEVTKCNRAEIALSLLRENKNGYDVVISDVHMPDMDGFKLLEHIGLEMDLPVIMMSADDTKAVVMKGVTHGACDYLIKPVRMEVLKNIWQHVVRKKKHEWRELEQSRSGEEVENRQGKQTQDADYSLSANEGSWRNSEKCKLDEEDLEDRDDSSTVNKPRVVWSVELHIQFVAAVNQLGIDKAVPKKILELMNVSGLTRVNVASHLQKYRLHLRRISGGVSQHSGGLNNGFMGSQDGPFGNMSSFSGLDLQAIAESGHLPAQSLATLQSSVFNKGNGLSVMPFPEIDQIPLSGSGMIQPPPLHLRTQLFNEAASSDSSKIPSAMGILKASNGANIFHMRNNNLIHDNRGTGFSPVTSFPMNTPDFSGNGFPLASAPGIMTPKGMLQNKIKGEMINDFDSGNNLLPQHYGQEDLMSALLKQAELEAAYMANTFEQMTHLREEYKDEPIPPYMANIFEHMTHQF